MRIGVPSETKTLEGRVALVPAACADLVRRGDRNRASVVKRRRRTLLGIPGRW